jgi:CRISPR type I-E-associated protein CasB/Cse2
MSNVMTVKDLLDSNITNEMSNFEISNMIDDFIFELKEAKSSYQGEISFADRQIALKESADAFFERIKNMSVGARAKIKRGLGVNTDFVDMGNIFYGKGYYIRESDKQIWDLCARLYCLFDCKEDKSMSFAKQLGKVCRSETSSAKFSNLLSTSTYDRFEYFSRDFIGFARQLKSSGLVFNFSELLVDLLNWNNKGSRVQLKWSSDFDSHLNNKGE